VKVDKQCRINANNIYAIGDIIPGLQLAHKASYEGKVATEAISGDRTKVDYIGIPAVAFVEPELAQVGLTEQEAKASGYNVKSVNIHLLQMAVPYPFKQKMVL
jgi:dihydrolipoamide dehydrogenase